MKSGNKVTCKFCGCIYVIKYGKKKGRQIYMCKSCGRRFIEPKELSWHYKPDHVVVRALDLYFKGLSLRKVSDYLMKYDGIYVSYGTVYRWGEELR